MTLFPSSITLYGSFFFLFCFDLCSDVVRGPWTVTSFGVLFEYFKRLFFFFFVVVDGTGGRLLVRLSSSFFFLFKMR